MKCPSYFLGKITNHKILLESESCPLVSEARPTGELCVGDGNTCALVSEPSLSRFTRVRDPRFKAEESDWSTALKTGGWGSCFGERCLFISTALPTVKIHTQIICMCVDTVWVEYLKVVKGDEICCELKVYSHLKSNPLCSGASEGRGCWETEAFSLSPPPLSQA